MTVSGARALIPFERGPGDPPAMKLRSGRKADKAERTEFVEIVLCRCWADHKAPSGKSGCGFWRYITFNSAG